MQKLMPSLHDSFILNIFMIVLPQKIAILKTLSFRLYANPFLVTFEFDPERIHEQLITVLVVDVTTKQAHVLQEVHVLPESILRDVLRSNDVEMDRNGNTKSPEDSDGKSFNN